MARLSFLSRSLLLGLALAAGGLAACDPPEVGPITSERHAACVEGYECASGKCDSPDELLAELGCFADVCVPMFGTVCLEPDLAYPNCEDENKGPSTYCGVEDCKAECVTICDANDNGMTDTDEEACYDDCEGNDVDGCFVRRLACIEAYNTWKEDRVATQVEFNTCLDTCEGEMTSEMCDELELDEDVENNCDDLLRARQRGVTEAGNCTADPDNACDWECSDIYYEG